MIEIQIDCSQAINALQGYRNKLKNKTPLMANNVQNKPIANEEFNNYLIKCNNDLLNSPEKLELIYNKRGINKETVVLAVIGYDFKKDCWVIPVKKDSIIVGFEYRDPGLKSGKSKQVWKEPNTPCCLANVNQITPFTIYLIILEGFIDAYTYWQYLRERG